MNIYRPATQTLTPLQFPHQPLSSSSPDTTTSTSNPPTNDNLQSLIPSDKHHTKSLFSLDPQWFSLSCHPQLSDTLSLSFDSDSDEASIDVGLTGTSTPTPHYYVEDAAEEEQALYPSKGLKVYLAPVDPTPTVSLSSSTGTDSSTSRQTGPLPLPSYNRYRFFNQHQSNVNSTSLPMSSIASNASSAASTASSRLLDRLSDFEAKGWLNRSDARLYRQLIQKQSKSSYYRNQVHDDLDKIERKKSMQEAHGQIPKPMPAAVKPKPAKKTTAPAPVVKPTAQPRQTLQAVNNRTAMFMPQDHGSKPEITRQPVHPVKPPTVAKDITAQATNSISRRDSLASEASSTISTSISVSSTATSSFSDGIRHQAHQSRVTSTGNNTLPNPQSILLQKQHRHDFLSKRQQHVSWEDRSSVASADEEEAVGPVLPPNFSAKENTKAPITHEDKPVPAPQPEVKPAPVNQSAVQSNPTNTKKIGRSVSHLILEPAELWNGPNRLTEKQTQELFVEMCFFARMGFVQPPSCLQCSYKHSKKENSAHKPSKKCTRWVIWRKDAHTLLHPKLLDNNLVVVPCHIAQDLLAGKEVDGQVWNAGRKQLISANEPLTHE